MESTFVRYFGRRRSFLESEAGLLPLMATIVLFFLENRDILDDNRSKKKRQECRHRRVKYVQHHLGDFRHRGLAYRVPMSPHPHLGSRACDGPRRTVQRIQCDCYELNH